MDIFNCQYCSVSPFDYILDYIYGERSSKKDEKKNSNVTYDDSSSNNVSQVVSKFGEQVEKRSTNEILLLCRAWENYVHPRAKEYWKDSHQLQNILCKIANGITKNDDPILGDDYACVFWYGDKNKNDNCPIISVKKGNDSIETITYVNRVLIFLYADEASFQELQKKPKKAFTMACGNINCINLTHISLDD
ncbi:conserved Plasmodium protein, unknown function [Plasmodium relictum]|uniref:Uncharacterized protein n=1 Tax=Plasmodium relictum TaxID=85471 RepID=A0A1J1HBI6_PLARL|nr:conserved Plasmodium protein, unknown function [Plasmodium relictum]CRH02663.1 conserved Plasmodium protein, unknown function [Plasmodium relictum]